MAPFALVANLTTRWRHLHKLQIWPPDGTTCISSKFVHQMALLALALKLTTRLHHCIATLPWIALLAFSVNFELVSSSARVASVKFQKGVGQSGGHLGTKIRPSSSGSSGVWSGNLTTPYPTHFHRLPTHLSYLLNLSLGDLGQTPFDQSQSGGHGV